MNVKSRDWCFTLNNYSDSEIEKIEELQVITKYLIYGKEVGKSGTPHLQGYIYFDNARTFSKIKKLLPERSHIEKTQGTPLQASDYCKKDNLYVEFGELPKQGKRSDLEQVRTMIQEGKGMRDIVQVAHSYQSVKMAECILKYCEKVRTWQTNIIWYYGPTGTGKTYTAWKKFGYDNTYLKAGATGKWFDGYDAHENVIIDDIRHDMFDKFTTYLGLFDNYPFTIETKGGTRQFLAKNIIITCPFHPIYVFKKWGEEEDLDQIIRRISSIVYFPKEDEKPPNYVQQFLDKFKIKA